MSIHLFRGNLFTHRLLALIAFGIFLAACGHHSDAQPRTSQHPDRGGFFEPEPGREADFFRAVEVHITVDFDQPSIAVEPFDPFCPSEEAERAGECNIVRFEAPTRPHGEGMQASVDDTSTFLADMTSRKRATTTYRLPRIFYPPTSDGKESRQADSGCRPKYPARQYRWTVLCKDGSNDCLRRDDQVIIRPKVSGARSRCAVTLPHHEPNFALLDRLAAFFPEFNCLRDFTAPQMSGDMPEGRRDPQAVREYVASDRYKGFVEKHNAHFAAKAKNDVAQAKTLFSPQTSATLSITAACGSEASECPGCCRGSVTSGIPYRPRFLKPGSGIMWSYGIELWRNGECVAELDPPGWVEDDSGPPSGDPGG